MQSKRCFFIGKGTRSYGTDVNQFSFIRRPYFLPLSLFLGSTTGLFTYYQYQAYRKGLPEGVTPARHALYSTIPACTMTRIAGWIANLRLPEVLRPSVVGLFSRALGCDAREAEKEVGEYESLGEFFARRLKSGARPLERGAALVSPVDGKVLATGCINWNDDADWLEQIKGTKYSLSAFLGHDHALINNLRQRKEGTSLYYTTLYLSPASYHRFHAPTDLKLSNSKKIPGELLPVAPWMMKLAPGLVSLNQRHLISGNWSQGHLVMVPVGATNVGSIVIDVLPGEKVKKGQELGHFRLGSTVVLLFTGPQGMKFVPQVGRSVKLGQALIRDNGQGWWFSNTFFGLWTK